MFNEKFEKEAFKKEVKTNIRNLYRKTIDEADSTADFSGSKHMR